MKNESASVFASANAAIALRQAPPAAMPAASFSSSTLLQGRSVVHIEHNGALYQLRSTRLGKLILTK